MLPVIDHKLAYVVAILAGTLITALCVIVVKSMSGRKAQESNP